MQELVALGLLLVIFTTELSAKSLRTSFLAIHGGGYTTNTVGVISQDYKPL
jgi:dUTPase